MNSSSSSSSQQPAKQEHKSSNTHEKIQVAKCSLLIDGRIEFESSRIGNKLQNISLFKKQKPDTFKSQTAVLPTYNQKFFHSINTTMGIQVTWNDEEKHFELQRYRIKVPYLLNCLTAWLVEFNTANHSSYTIVHQKPSCSTKTLGKRRRDGSSASSSSSASASAQEPQAQQPPMETQNTTIIYVASSLEGNKAPKDYIIFDKPAVIYKFFSWIIGDNAYRNVLFFNLFTLVQAGEDAGCEVSKELIDKLDRVTKAVDSQPMEQQKTRPVKKQKTDSQSNQFLLLCAQPGLLHKMALLGASTTSVEKLRREPAYRVLRDQFKAVISDTQPPVLGAPLPTAWSAPVQQLQPLPPAPAPATESLLLPPAPTPIQQPQQFQRTSEEFLQLPPMTPVHATEQQSLLEEEPLLGPSNT